MADHEYLLVRTDVPSEPGKDRLGEKARRELLPPFQYRRTLERGPDDLGRDPAADRVARDDPVDVSDVADQALRRLAGRGRALGGQWPFGVVRPPGRVALDRRPVAQNDETDSPGCERHADPEDQRAGTGRRRSLARSPVVPGAGRSRTTWAMSCA